MPLNDNALVLIRSNLEAIQKGQRVKPVVIGTLTKAQLDAINKQRAAHSIPLSPVVAEVIFFGKHIYQSRIEKDGYSIDDVLTQIEVLFRPVAWSLNRLK
jgi:hypothetical protein